MNFFAHYYFDHKPSKPIYNFGLLTPDLLRNFTPNDYNKHLLVHPTQHSPWFEGISQHINRDKSFHHSPFFDAVYKNCRENCKSVFEICKIPRFWFALHVVIEMILDKVLIQQDNEKLSQFYLELETVKPELPVLLGQIEHQNIPLFEQRFDRFLESKYLYKYQESHGIIYGLNRVFIQVGASNREWNETQYLQLTHLVNHIEREIELHLNLLQHS